MMVNNKVYIMIFSSASLLLAVVSFWSGLTELVHRWGYQPEYGHGYFIPLLTLWFLWERKKNLLNSIGDGSYWGTSLVLLACLLLFLGEVTAFYFVIELGFVIFLLGLLLSMGGKQLFKVGFTPVIFLVFCIPLPYFLEALLTAKLQLSSSQIGVSILRFIGISVYLEGNVIDLGEYRLQVVEACSGLRYLYPLTGIAFLMAFVYQAQFWKKLTLFLSAIPITVVMNSVRISFVGVLVDRWGIAMAEGFLHYFEGWVIFIICLAILVAEIAILEKFGQKRTLLLALNIPVSVDLQKQTNITTRPLLITLLIIVLSTIITIKLGDRKELSPGHKSLNLFPLSIADWVGEQDALSSNELRMLSLAEYFLANYKNTNGDELNYYIAYYASQRKGISPHSPQVCMPGGGWVISSLKRVPISNGQGGSFLANRVVIQKNDAKQLVYYWYQQRGRQIADEYDMKFYLLKDAIFKNRTDGALVRLVAPVNKYEQLTDEYILQFIAKSLPYLPKYIPN